MIRFIVDDAKQISDLTFIGDAIDLPYYDFVVGVQPMSAGQPIAYNHGEGESFKSHLLRLTETTVLHLSHQPQPPKERAADLLNGVFERLDVKPIQARYAIAILQPQHTQDQVTFVNTPEELLGDGVVEESPETLLSMLKQRIYDQAEPELN